MTFEIGDKVVTPRGEGLIIDKSYTFHDGDIFLVRLNNGQQIWRTAKGLTLMTFEIGDKVVTPRGEGLIIDKSYTFHDGDIFLVRLNNGQQIWRTAKGLTLIEEAKNA